MAGEVTNDHQMNVQDGHGQTVDEPTPGHNEKMIQTYEQGRPPADPAQAPTDPPADGGTDVAPMPEGGHEKFYNDTTGEYNWQAHAKEAEFNLSRGRPPEPQKDSQGKEGAPSGEKKGFDLDQYSSEFAQLGYLTDESYKELEEAGIPRQMVDSYIEGEKTKVSEFRSHAFKLVGGEDNYLAMLDWAQQNLSGEEKAVFNQNTLVNGPDADAAIKGLFARFEGEVGQVSNYVEGGGSGPVSGGESYGSTEEMMKDMGDPRYATDENFREEVRQKLARSNIMNDVTGPKRLTANNPTSYSRI